MGKEKKNGNTPTMRQAEWKYRVFTEKGGGTGKTAAFLLLSLHLLFGLPCVAGQADHIGTLPGNLEVSSSGSVRYEIPIEVPPGTRGVQPSLSIVYDSRGGLGELGMKWSLSGISSIRRVPQTPYHDGNLRAVSMGAGDRFALDGNRLLSLPGESYGDPQTGYLPEVENFTRLESGGGVASDPTRFDGYDAEGNKLEYTASDPAPHATWRISRVVDPQGNQMSYTHGHSNREVWLERIDYSSSLNTSGTNYYARVLFEYAQPGHLGSDFAGGYETPHTRLLTGIAVQHKGSGEWRDVRRYSFSYRDGHPPKLSAIRMCDSAGRCLPPTILEWVETSEGSFTENTSDLPFNTYCNFAAADLNGDHRADIVEEYNGSYRVYLRGEVVFNTASVQHSPLVESGSHIAQMFSADTDGDGREELISVQSTPAGFKIVRTRLSTDGIIRSDMYHRLAHDGNLSVMAGDFLGNGKAGLLIGTNTRFTVMGTGFSTLIDCGEGGWTPELLDFNGNGKTDIMLVRSANGMARFYEYNTTSEGFELFGEMTFPIGVLPRAADFNGDGISDLVWRSGGSNYSVRLGTGAGFAPAITVQFTHTASDRQPLLCDVNGDGRGDFVGFSSSGGGLYANYYLCLGYYGNTLHFAPHPSPRICPSPNSYSVVPADYNADYALDFLAISSNGTGDRFLSFSRDLREPLVERITDGMGGYNKISYKLFHSSGFDLYTGRRWMVSFFLPQAVERPTGFENRIRNVSHVYAFPQKSHRRRTFLGFKEHDSYDNVLLEVHDRDFTRNDLKETLDLTSESVTLTGVSAWNRTLDPRAADLPDGNFMPYVAREEMVDGIALKSVITQKTLNADGLPASIHERLHPSGNPQFLTGTTTYYEYTQLTTPLYGTRCWKPVRTQEFSFLNGNTSWAMMRQVETSYRSDGLPTQTVDSGAGWSVTTRYANHDPFGNARQVTIIAGNTTRTETFVFDPTGRFPIRHTNALGQVSLRAYDPRTGNLLSETGVDGLSTTYGYDGLGREAWRQYPDGTRTETLILANPDIGLQGSWQIRTQTTGGATTISYRDFLGREVCRKNEGNSYQDTRYDNKGQVKAASLPYANYGTDDGEKEWTNYTYDHFGRIYSEISPTSHFTHTYNGRRVTTTDHLRGISSWKEQDAAGRPSASSDPGGIITHAYRYEMTGAGVFLLQETTLEGHTTTIRFDDRGNKVSIDDPDAGESLFEYSQRGNLLSRTDANGNSIHYTYDILDRVTYEKTVYAADGHGSTVKYFYDTHSPSNRGMGKLSATQVDEQEKRTITYDSLGRVCKESIIVNGEPFEQFHTYDALGRLDKVTFPGLFAIRYAYDGEGRLQGILREDDGTPVCQIGSCDPFGRALSFRLGNGLGTKLSCDPSGRITGIATGKTREVLPDPPIIIPPGGTMPQLMAAASSSSSQSGLYLPFAVDSSVQKLSYAYDGLGRMIRREDRLRGQWESFSYDNLDRLLSSQVRGQMQEEFTYFPSGNLYIHSSIGKFHYDGSKPHAITSADLNYEEAMPLPDCLVEYDGQGRPISISEGGNLVEFSHGDGPGREMEHWSMADGAEWLRLRPFPDFELEATPDGSERWQSYIRAGNRVVAVAVQEHFHGPATLYYVHTDPLGSWLAVTDEEGTLVESLHYDPWGNRRQAGDCSHPDHRNSFLFNRGFTGHPHLDPFGIIHMGGRLYDPLTTRFFSPDPFVQLPDNSQSFNRYSYCLNNPLGYVDPTGFLFSDHFDSFGNLIAHYDDGDNSVYVHSDGVTKTDIDWQRVARGNTGGDGLKIGELGGSIDISLILENKLSQSALEAGSMDIMDYYHAVKTGGPWDLKSNRNTIWGVAWDYDYSTQSKTNFSSRRFYRADAADVGNYHAGFAGEFAGIPHYVLWKGAGFAETMKSFGKGQIWDGIKRSFFLVNPFSFTSGDRSEDWKYNTMGMDDARRGVKIWRKQP